MQEYGVDIRGHDPQQLTPQLVSEAEVVLCMTLSQKTEVLEEAPDADKGVFTLSEFVADDPIRDISDPAGMGRDFYKDTARELWELMEGLAPALRAYRRG